MKALTVRELLSRLFELPVEQWELPVKTNDYDYEGKHCYNIIIDAQVRNGVVELIELGE